MQRLISQFLVPLANQLQVIECRYQILLFYTHCLSVYQMKAEVLRNIFSYVFKANALLTGNLKWRVFAAFLAKQVPL